MRAPCKTFRDELKAFAARLPPPVDDHWKGRLPREVLGRWIDHPECESIWVTLRPLLPADMTAGDFIGEILSARNDAEQHNLLVQGMSDLTAKTKARAKRLLSDDKFSQSGEVSTLLGRVIDRHARVFGREKTGPRRVFMWRLSEGLALWCGQPLYDVGRVLTDIAFGGETTIEAVRKARKRDRTTRPPK